MKQEMFVLSAACLIASCVVIRVNQDLVEVRTEDYELTKGSEINFQNTNGDLEVTEWESDFVQIETLIYGDSSVGVPEDLDIHFEKMGENLSVLVDYPDKIFGCSVDFAVRIPYNSDYIVVNNTQNGDTFIDGDVFVEVFASNGDMQISAISANGLVSSNGDIMVELSEQKGSLEISTSNGDISASLIVLNDLMKIESSNGDILVNIPVNTGFEISTGNGDISVDGLEIDESFFIDGDSMASIVTANGDIAIRRIGVL